MSTETTPKLDTHVQAVQIDIENAATNVCVEVPKLYRYIALACIISLPLGTNWTQSSVGPLKNTLRNEWNISNAQFGVISSADAFVNTVFPILGGLILDWWGPNIVTLCCTTIILVGSLIAAGSTINNMWRLLVGGHVLMGFGIAVLDSAQQKVSMEFLLANVPDLILMGTSSSIIGLAPPDLLSRLASKTLSLV